MLAFASDGGFAEFVAVPARSLARIPGALTFVQAAPVACSVTTALHAAAVAGAGAADVAVLVGTADSGRQALAALAPGGALVYVGCSAERIELDPVRLVVPEQRILTSVSDTLAELEQGLDLVARGVVRSVVDRTEPLEAVDEVLGALARGEVTGRAVLVP